MVAVLEMEWEGAAGWDDGEVGNGYCSCLTVTGGRVGNVALSLVSSSLSLIVCRVLFTYISNAFVFSSQFIGSNFSGLQTAFCCFNWGCTRKYRFMFHTYWIKKKRQERKASKHTVECQSELKSEHVLPGAVSKRTGSHSLVRSLWVLYALSSQQKGIKLKMGGHKLRSEVNWKGSLKQKGVKQGLPILCIISLWLASVYPEDVDSRFLQIITGLPDKTALHPTKLLTYIQHSENLRFVKFICAYSLIF